MTTAIVSTGGIGSVIARQLASGGETMRSRSPAMSRHGGWLQINDLNTEGRPVVTERLGPLWGYHLDDINLALGNLVQDVATQEAAYNARH